MTPEELAAIKRRYSHPPTVVSLGDLATMPPVRQWLQEYYDDMFALITEVERFHKEQSEQKERTRLAQAEHDERGRHLSLSLSRGEAEELDEESEAEAEAEILTVYGGLAEQYWHANQRLADEEGKEQ